MEGAACPSPSQPAYTTGRAVGSDHDSRSIPFFCYYVRADDQTHNNRGFFVVNSNKINHTNATRTSAGYLLESSWCFHFPATPLTIVLLCSFRKWSLSD
jgi:hypothetical protein